MNNQRVNNDPLEARRSAIAWARALVTQGDYAICDTETSGMTNDGEVIEVAILSCDGKQWVQQRVRPKNPISRDATLVHGISDAVMNLAPYYNEIHSWLYRILGPSLTIFYNAAFDLRLLGQTATLYGLSSPIGVSDCAMLQYSKFCGSWNDYRGDWRWQKLPALPGQRAHSALADCRSTLAVIRQMAGAKDE